MESKVCSKCKKEKPIKKFAIGARFLRNTVCNDCQNDYVKARFHKTAPWLEDWIYKD